MTASGQEPRRHHLVPRFYLDRWAEAGRVQVTDLDQRQLSYSVAPKNALVETDYYRIPAGAVEGGSPVAWEAWLSKVEGDAAEAFAVIDGGGLQALDVSQRTHLVHFIGVQITRSRSYRFMGRWMMGPGYFRLWELDRPGALESHLQQGGQAVTPERLEQVRAYFETVSSDPWKAPVSPEQEMDMAMRAAGGLAETIATRKLAIYRTTKPLLTSDEPVVQVFESMAADHPTGGGYYGAPILVFPLGPHQILAMFRSNMPVPMNLAEIGWHDTLDLNRVIAGNAHRHIVERPGGKLGSRMYIPDRKDPAKIVTIPSTHGGPELTWMPSQRRWHGEPDAPTRPVAPWWPAVVPPPPRGPATESEWRQERAQYDARS